jgi:hypothetical protein
MNATRSTSVEPAATNQPSQEYKCLSCGGPAADWSKIVCDPCNEKVNGNSPC